jgi:hypothetical protein
VPLSRVLRKPINETGFENPKYGKLGEWWELFGNFIWGSMSFLKKDPDWAITFRGEGYHLGVCSPDETSGVTLWNSLACTVLGVTPITWYIHF